MNVVLDRTTENHAIRTNSVPTDTPMIAVDSEVARLAVVTGNTSIFAIWHVSRYLSINGCNHVHLDKLRDVYSHYSDKQFNRLLQKGNGFFWTITQDRMYYKSIKRIAVALVHAAGTHEYKHTTAENVLSHLPGIRPTRIPLDIFMQSVGTIKAYFYAARIGENGRTISRETQSNLWDVTKPTLIKWDDIAGITVKKQKAQTANLEDRRIPLREDVKAYNTVNDSGELVTGCQWQIANRYVSNLRSHHATGQARKIRNTLSKHSNSFPVYKTQTGTYERLYFDSVDRFKRVARKYGIESTARYLWLGERKGTQIFELVDNEYGYTKTSLIGHISPQATYEFSQWDKAVDKNFTPKDTQVSTHTYTPKPPSKQTKNPFRKAAHDMCNAARITHEGSYPKKHHLNLVSHQDAQRKAQVILDTAYHAKRVLTHKGYHGYKSKLQNKRNGMNKDELYGFALAVIAADKAGTLPRRVHELKYTAICPPVDRIQQPTITQGKLL